MQRHMILVCHDADGAFADGNRAAVHRVLEKYTVHSGAPGSFWISITCPDGGQLDIYAPGLDGRRTFHRMEVVCKTGATTPDLVALLLELMRAGGFGLLNGLDSPQLIVTSPQQVTYFPWLPEPPLLVRNPHDLSRTLL